MWSNILDRISSTALFLIVALLPVFVLPYTGIPVEISKGLLLVIGLAISLIFWTAARFSDGRVNFPKSPVLLAAAGVAFATLLSAFFSDASAMSFFGIIFDTSSFWFVFAAVMLMFIAAVTVKEESSAQMLLFGVALATVVALLFQILRFFLPTQLGLGVMGMNVDNLIGSLNALGLMAGFACLASLFVIEFFSISRTSKMVFGFFIAVSLFLVAAVNYRLVWELLGIFTLLIFVYKISYYARERTEGGRVRFPLLSFSILIIALLFFISGQFIGGFLPSKLQVFNTEVSPSLGGTLLVGRDVLKKDPIFGIGPNRFTEAWAMNKPQSINGTPFWDISFSSGSGTLPTFLATTGSLGILSWLLFFGFFILSGVKSLFQSIRSSVGRELAVFFLLSLYLFAASFFYSVGPVILLLAFAFAGVFIGLASRETGGELPVHFLDDHRKSFFFILSLVVVMVLAAAAAFKYIERFASVSHFRKSLQAGTVEAAETSISKALSLHRNDLYMRTYAQVYLVKLNTLLNQKKTQLSEAEKAELQQSFDQALLGSTGAIGYNPKNYINHQNLANVYSVAGALGVEGAYDRAVEAYRAASALNPINPGIKLAVAQALLVNKKTKDGKEEALAALKLKPDYIDAMLVLSQIAKNEGDTKTAISYAEQALALAPSNENLISYLNSLRAGN